MVATFIMPCGACYYCEHNLEDICDTFFAHNRLKVSSGVFKNFHLVAQIKAKDDLIIIFIGYFIRRENQVVFRKGWVGYCNVFDGGLC